MPVDPKLIDRLCDALADYHGQHVAVREANGALILSAGLDRLVYYPSGTPQRVSDVEDLTSGDLMVLVEVCDAWLHMQPALEALPGATKVDPVTLGVIRAVREKLRARL